MITKNLENKKMIRNIVYIGIFASIGFVLNLIQIPYIIPFLKIDFSEVVILLALSYSVGVAFQTALVKNILFFFFNPADPFGDFVLLIGSLTLILGYIVFNKFFSKKISLFFTCLFFVLVMVAGNYYFITPFYLHQTIAELREQMNYDAFIFWTYIPFNLIKIYLIYIIYLFIEPKLKMQR